MTWKGLDADIPAGTVGRIGRVYGDGDVEVTFPNQRGGEPFNFTFQESRLDLAEDQGLRAVAFEMQLSSPMGMDLGALTLLVKSVELKGQAALAGVAAGWRVTKVAGKIVVLLSDFVGALDAQRAAGATSCSVSFSYQAESRNRIAVSSHAALFSS